MNLKDVIIVGIALAMDAVGVTVSIGVNPKVMRKSKIAFIMSFAIFQFLFFLLGGIGGHLFEKYITTIPNIVGGVAIAVVGILMIKEGFEYKYPNGESLIDTFYRAKNQIEIILEQNKNKSILICSHGGTIRNIISYLLCNDYKYHWNFRVDNGSITEIEVNNNFAVINKMNDTTYFKL